MKRLTASIFVIAVSLITVAFAVAQQSAPQHGGVQPSGASAPKPGTPHDHDAHHGQHMEVCRQMMSQSGMMGGGMMPMTGGDPKHQAE